MTGRNESEPLEGAALAVAILHNPFYRAVVRRAINEPAPVDNQPEPPIPPEPELLRLNNEVN